MRRIAVATVLAGVLLSSCGPGAARTDRVRIFDDPARPESQWGYDPPRIEVSQGTTVTFTNAGTVFHTVTSDDPGRTFDAGASPGQAVTVRFDRPGDQAYHCGVHPAMKGVVHVCEGACR